jgi:hypothetical protein
LTYIDLTGCTQVTNIALQELELACPNIGIISLCIFCSFLFFLTATSKYKITDRSDVHSMLTRFFFLFELVVVTLIVANCPKLSDAAFEYLGREVKVLDLTNCELVTNKTLLTIASRCLKLKSLKISGKNIRYLNLQSQHNTTQHNTSHNQSLFFEVILKLVYLLFITVIWELQRLPNVVMN